MAKEEKTKLGYWIKDASDVSERDMENATFIRVEVQTEHRYKCYKLEAYKLFSGEFAPIDLLEDFDIFADDVEGFNECSWSGSGNYATGNTCYGGSYGDECELWDETESFEINTYVNFIDGYEPDLTDAVDLLAHAS